MNLKTLKVKRWNLKVLTKSVFFSNLSEIGTGFDTKSIFCSLILNGGTDLKNK